MELRQLNGFLLIANLGSFTAAAARLKVAQPALSRDIKLLERELATKLFHRHGRGVSLTEHGIAFRDAISVHVEGIEAAKSGLGRDKSPGFVRLGWTSGISGPIGADVISQFSHLHPGVELRVRTAASAMVEDWVAADEIDVGVILREKRTSSEQIRPFMTTNLVFICRHGRSGARACHSSGETLPFAEALASPIILFGRHHSVRLLVEDTANYLGLKLDILAEVEELHITKQLIKENGVGAIIAQSLLGHIAREEALQCQVIVDPSLLLYFSFIHPRPKRCNALVSELEQIIKTSSINAISENRMAAQMIEHPGHLTELSS
jgi:LysR family nitrogen assimilation transcriptional regulator